MITRNAKRFLAAFGFTCGATCLAMQVAYGVDGVVLINQSKALAGGVTPGDAPGFPVTISRRGSYRLTTNLHVTSNENGIEVGAVDVSIDLNGFTIRGQGVIGSDDGISVILGNQPLPRLSVTNGVVADFGRFGVFHGSQARITRLRVEGNALGGIVNGVGGGPGSIVSDNTVVSNGGPGIRELGSGDLVSGNILWFNRGIGISGGGNCIVKDNAVSNSGADGIFAGNGGLVVGNTARENGGLGLLLDTGVGYKDNVLTENNGSSANPQVNALGIEIGTNVCGNDTVCP